jgi:hypothetical protein
MVYKPLIELALRHDSLSVYAKIASVVDGTHFVADSLAGWGDEYFQNWGVFVVRDAAGAGAAPQDELETVSDYTNDGTFTHTAFTAGLGVDDEIFLIHPVIMLIIGGGGGGTAGTREIWESFEYVSDAALQAVWLTGVPAVTCTRSAVVPGWFPSQWSMQAVVGAGAGYVYRTFTERNLKTLANITVAARSNVPGDTFRFTIYDSSGNYSYWTQTITLANTWYDFEINIHTTPTGSSATPADLEHSVEIRLANLTALSTYLFDLIIFEGLVSEDIEEINYADSVYVDDGGVDAVFYPYGTPTHPTSSILNGVTIAAARNLNKIHVAGLHGVNTDISGYEFQGVSGPFAFAILTFAAPVVTTNTAFRRCAVTGDLNGIIAVYDGSVLINVTGLDGTIRDAQISGVIELAAPTLGWTDFDNITTLLGPATIDCANLLAGNIISIDNFSGAITFTNLVAAAQINIYSSTGAQVTIDVSCTAGTIRVFGNCNVTNNSLTTVVIEHTINQEVKRVFDIVNAELVTTETGGTITTDGTEQTIYINNAPAGVFEPRAIQLDFTNQTAAETVVIRTYYRINPAGGLIKQDEVSFAGVQDPLLKTIRLVENRYGIKVTIQKIAGSNLAYDWEVIYRA